MKTKNNYGWLKALSWLLYVLGGLTLLIGVISLISFYNFSANLPAMLVTLQLMGLGPLVDALTGMARGAVISLGWLIFMLSLGIGVLLTAGGRLATLVRDLSLRLDQTEQHLYRQDLEVAPSTTPKG